MNAVVRAHGPAVLVDDRSCVAAPGARFAHKRRVVAVGHEADLLAVRLVGHREARRRARARTSYFVRSPTGKTARASCSCVNENRKYDWSFAGVGAALQQYLPAVGVAVDPRVVTGRNLLGAEATRALEQRRKLQVAVAVRAGKRRAAGAYSRTKFETTCSSNCTLEIQDVMRDPIVVPRAAHRADRRACSSVPNALAVP